MAEQGIDPNIGVKRPDYFYFSGGAMSLQSRLDALTDEEANMLIDAKLIVRGVEVKEGRQGCQMCMLIFGCMFIIPLIIVCLPCFQKWAS